MKRLSIQPRNDYKAKLESIGINYHTHEDGAPYWFEKAAYSFTEQEVLRLESAVNELQSMCISVLSKVIETRNFEGFQIPSEFYDYIVDSWGRDEVSIYGRFDIAYNADTKSIKMLEYNADTPTSLVEASIGQWHWLQDYAKNNDQWNSLHERLIDVWKRVKDFTPIGPITFIGLDTWEDWQTITYMRDIAVQAGWQTDQMNLLDLGWDSGRNVFTNLDGVPVATAFKLYPWEHMVKEEYGQHLCSTIRPITFLEPAWKMLLSNKYILVKLWEMYPNHKYLLPAYTSELPLAGMEYVKKPIFGREGADISVIRHNSTTDSEKHGYGEEGFIYQQLADIKQFNGITPMLGCWVVDGEAAGLGIRESDNFVTDNRSRFVPHFIGE